MMEVKEKGMSVYKKAKGKEGEMARKSEWEENTRLDIEKCRMIYELVKGNEYTLMSFSFKLGYYWGPHDLETRV